MRRAWLAWAAIPVDHRELPEPWPDHPAIPQWLDELDGANLVALLPDDRYLDALLAPGPKDAELAGPRLPLDTLCVSSATSYRVDTPGHRPSSVTSSLCPDPTPARWGARPYGAGAATSGTGAPRSAYA